MYRISLLPRKVLLVHDEVIKQTAIDQNADPRQLVAAIQIAEERFVKPALGVELYNALRDAKNRTVTDDNRMDLQQKSSLQLKVGDILNALELVENEWYRELWNEHLWKYAAECVVYIATPTNFSQFTATGEMQNNPKSVAMTNGAGSAAVDLKDMQWKLNKLLQDRIDPLRAAMHEWLCEKVEHFELYKEKCPCKGDGTSGVSVKRKTGWIHGIYNDRRKGDCCDDD